MSSPDLEYNNLSELISKNALKYPDKPVIFFKDSIFTYSKVEEIVRHTAGVLYKNGVRFGDRVAILLENSPDFIFAYISIAKIGAVAVPTNVFLKELEIAANLNDCSASYIITSNTFAERINQLPKLMLDLKKVFTFTKATFDSVVITTAEAELKPIKVNKDDLAMVLYTSGTTGKSKGAMLTHNNFISNAASFSKAAVLRHDDRMLLLLPMFHATSLTGCINCLFIHGGSIIIMESILEVNRAEYPKVLERLKPTLLVGVPALYSTLAKVKHAGEIRESFPFRLCMCGGAPLPEEIINRFKTVYNTVILEGYGLSEASPVIAFNPIAKQKIGSIGLPIDGVKVRIVDDYGNDLPANTPGELIAKGPNITKGYWGQEDETEKVLKDGWLYTGDIATKDKEGYLYIIDRKKDLILVKGMNLYPREVEELLYKYNGVISAAVVGVPDGEGSEIPVAYLKLDPAENITIDGIKAYLRHNLASYKVPRYITVTDDIPLNAGGKVVKRALKERATEEHKTRLLK
ncbi:MAG: AMP-binding protein [Deferribacteraceae bacterium]|jgi:long-chain acyl-CoA synthetase|nr:AMP-binding protein [Deferribacteraceae bacterium]